MTPDEIRAELRKGQSFVTPGGLKHWPALDSFNAIVAESDRLREALRLHLETHDGLDPERPCSCDACHAGRQALGPADRRDDAAR